MSRFGARDKLSRELSQGLNCLARLDKMSG